LILDIEALEAKREKMQRDLDILTDNINLAKKQLRRLENFLKRLGIDSKAYTYNLHISNDLALRAALPTIRVMMLWRLKLTLSLLIL
jgi:hypothetical protein